MRIARSLGVGLLVVGCLVAVAAVAVRFTQPDLPRPLHGMVFQPPNQAPDLPLIDQEGRPFSLNRHRGKLLLLFFGYTVCPDVCPTTLIELANARKRLGAGAGKIQVIFVTVDPERDTPQALKRYLAYFDRTFIGLSGDPETVAGVAKAYGVRYGKRPTSTPGWYFVDHTALTYLIDRAGRLLAAYPYGTSVDDLVADLKSLTGGKR
jgi:protein SCO1/2